MLGGQVEEALAHVHQALRHAHQEQQRRFLIVVAAEAPQHARQPRIVGSRSDQACAFQVWLSGRARSILVMAHLEGQ